MEAGRDEIGIETVPMESPPLACQQSLCDRPGAGASLRRLGLDRETLTARAAATCAGPRPGSEPLSIFEMRKIYCGFIM